MNKFYLSFCIIGVFAFLIWGYVVPIANPGILVDSFSHRLFIMLPFIIMTLAHLFNKKVNIEAAAYLGMAIVTADYCYLIQVNNSMFHSTGLYVVLTVCLSAINNRRFLFLYSILFSIFSIYKIFTASELLDKVHWGNMLTLILLAAFFGLWRIKRLEQLEAEYMDNLEKSKKLEDLNNFAAQAAHDIRSPVMALEAVAKTTSGLDPAKLKIISDAAQRVNNIADNLVHEYKKTLSSSEKPSLNKDIFDEQTIQEIIESLKEEKLILQSDFRKYKIHIHGNIEYKIQDPKLQFELKRVISNLINNSIEAFSDSNGKIDLILSEATESFSIEVKDNGQGIPKHIQNNLFQKGATFNKTSGTGLGLFHAKETIEKFSGRIDLSSKEGLGTLVQIVLPKI